MKETKTLSLAILSLLMWSVELPAKSRPALTIRSVDFRNFTFEKSGSWNGKLILRNGSYQEKDPTSLYQTAKLVALRFVDIDDDRKEEAVVAIRSNFPGSMPVAMDYYVFAYRDGTAYQVFHKWQEGPEGICIRGKSLIIVAAVWEDTDAHCCPSYTERRVYRWSGGQLKVASRRAWKNYPFQYPGRLRRANPCG